MRKIWKKSLVFMLALNFQTVMLVHADEASGDVVTEEKTVIQDEEGWLTESEESPADLGEEVSPYINDNTFIEDDLEDLGEPPEDVLEYSPGWNGKDGEWFYADESGQLLTGWQLIKGAWYYLDGENSEKPGVMLADQKMVIDSQTYFFSQSGAMLTGWVQRPEGWYYANKSGTMLTGWQLIGGTWYYLDRDNPENSGLMLSNCNYRIAGETYAFDDNGGMKTGWVQRREGWYYADASGALADGWRCVGGAWYYLDGANEDYPNLMLSSCERQIDGVTYYFNPSGSMRAGWYLDGKDWYYYDTVTGQIVSGWEKVGGTWYYLDPANGNKMESGGWKLIGGTWYYFHSSGAMATNWLLLGNSWYYLGADGAMRTGWQFVGNNWYYMYTANDPHGGSEGVMASNRTIDGYYVGSDGAWLTEADLLARDTLNRVGWNLRAAYNWSTRFKYYKMTEEPSPGSEWFAVYGFRNNRGNCYVMAATFCYMARQLGYDAHQVAGAVPTQSGGLSPHSWCEINIGGTIYVFDPSFEQGTKRNGYQISYGTSGTWKYCNYYRIN